MSIITRKFKLGLVATALAMTAVVSVSYAFAASNTTPPSKAGEGASVTSGYTINAISYTLDGTDPTLVDAVDFKLTPAPSVLDGNVAVAKIQVDSVVGTWYDSVISGQAVSCNTTPGGAPLASAINELKAVVADNQ